MSERVRMGRPTMVQNRTESDSCAVCVCMDGWMDMCIHMCWNFVCIIPSIDGNFDGPNNHCSPLRFRSRTKHPLRCRSRLSSFFARPWSGSRQSRSRPDKKSPMLTNWPITGVFSSALIKLSFISIRAFNLIYLLSLVAAIRCCIYY